MNAPNLPTLLQGFFTERLRTQLGASSYTVASYRDTFRLLLRFATERLKQAPSELRVEELAPAFVGDFLQHLELDRGNCTRTRNVRLAALHAFFRYVAVNEPAHALQCQRPPAEAGGLPWALEVPFRLKPATSRPTHVGFIVTRSHRQPGMYHPFPCAHRYTP